MIKVYGLTFHASVGVQGISGCTPSIGLVPGVVTGISELRLSHGFDIASGSRGPHFIPKVAPSIVSFLSLLLINLVDGVLI